MLKDLGETTPAERIRCPVETDLTRGECRTSDLGGKASTSQFTDALVQAIRT